MMLNWKLRKNADGKIMVKLKGTIKLLDSWVNKYFMPSDKKPIDEMLVTFRKVRDLRQKPAHKVHTNVFSQEHFRKQRVIVIRSYDAVRALRLILANHPKVKANPPHISEHLFKGEIWGI